MLSQFILESTEAEQSVTKRRPDQLWSWVWRDNTGTSESYRGLLHLQKSSRQRSSVSFLQSSLTTQISLSRFSSQEMAAGGKSSQQQYRTYGRSHMTLRHEDKLQLTDNGRLVWSRDLWNGCKNDLFFAVVPQCEVCMAVFVWTRQLSFIFGA